MRLPPEEGHGVFDSNNHTCQPLGGEMWAKLGGRSANWGLGGKAQKIKKTQKSATNAGKQTLLRSNNLWRAAPARFGQVGKYVLMLIHSKPKFCFCLRLHSKMKIRFCLHKRWPLTLIHPCFVCRISLLFVVVQCSIQQILSCSTLYTFSWNKKISLHFRLRKLMKPSICAIAKSTLRSARVFINEYWNFQQAHIDAICKLIDSYK